MQLVKPSYEHVSSTPEPEKLIARMARICWQSDDNKKLTDEKLIRHLIKFGHTSQLEHASASIIFGIDRGISHELVRTRIGVAFSQLSTRYVKFLNGIKVIAPYRKLTRESMDAFITSVVQSELSYNRLMADGCSPQEARDVLPTCLWTQIGVTMNFRAWRWLLALRTSSAAHPKVRHLAFNTWKILQPLAPNVFKTCPTVPEAEQDLEKAYQEWSAGPESTFNTEEV